MVVKPDTVAGRRRTGFRPFRRWRSRGRGSRPKITNEFRALIRRLIEDNPIGGAPKTHGELQKPGFVVFERTVARDLRLGRHRGYPGQRWLTFLKNHCEATVASDFFAVPTVRFRLLSCFFVIEHRRRMTLHFNITRHPNAERVVTQWREAFPEAGLHRRCALLDRGNSPLDRYRRASIL